MKILFSQVGSQEVHFNIDTDIVDKLFKEQYPSYMLDLPKIENIGEFVVTYLKDYVLTHNLTKAMQKNFVKALNIIDSSLFDCTTEYYKKVAFTNLTGNMFSSDDFSLFLAMFGKSPKDYRVSLVERYVMECNEDTRYICKHGLGDIRICDLPLVLSEPFREYTVTFNDLMANIRVELTGSKKGFSHFFMVYRNVKAIRQFIELVK